MKKLENNKDIVILNEYDEEISVKDFLEMVEEKQENNNPDNFNYNVKNVDGYRFSDNDFS